MWRHVRDILLFAGGSTGSATGFPRGRRAPDSALAVRGDDGAPAFLRGDRGGGEVVGRLRRRYPGHHRLPAVVAAGEVIVWAIQHAIG